ncbi:DeoR/GlpR family DNA-binding transcription regulator [Amphibacillus sp. Q70]|uniref:DeoR/GlpR family DNA-binding transcription regulator n=1 Tax=Amphibacillus sp. Q70 TaxID=3453416 RepID=UPI003F87A414
MIYIIQKERLNLIMSKLELKKSLSLKEIIELTGASRDTARRDVIKLAEKNLVQRTYGGIALPESFKQLDNYLKRSSKQNHEKKQLAESASQLIKNSQTVYLDVSTTVSFIPQYLKETETLFTVTNSIDIADQLLRNTSCRTRILGGNLDQEKRCVVGTKPLRELDDYKFDLAFLSVAGLGSDGIYYAHEEDIDLKNKIRMQSEKVIFLIDTSKLNMTHNFKVFDFTEVDIIILNGRLSKELEVLLKNNHVQIIYTEGD